MKAPTLLATAALLIVAPLLAGCVATDPPLAPASKDDAAPARADATTGSLTFVLHNSGKADDAQVELRKASGELVDSSRLHVPADAEAMKIWTLPLGAYRVSVTTLGVSGASPVDLGACASHDVQQRVNVSFDGIGGSYRGEPATCRPAAEGPKDVTVRGTTKADLIVQTPVLSMGGSPRLGFPVAAGARSIEIVAAWSPTTPLSDRLTIDLWRVTPDGSKDVAHASGSRTATIRYDAPEAGDYRVGAWVEGDAGAAYDQEVAYEITVRSA